MRISEFWAQLGKMKGKFEVQDDDFIRIKPDETGSIAACPVSAVCNLIHPHAGYKDSIFEPAREIGLNEEEAASVATAADSSSADLYYSYCCNQDSELTLKRLKYRLKMLDVLGLTEVAGSSAPKAVVNAIKHRHKVPVISEK